MTCKCIFIALIYGLWVLAYNLVATLDKYRKKRAQGKTKKLLAPNKVNGFDSKPEYQILVLLLHFNL